METNYAVDERVLKNPALAAALSQNAEMLELAQVLRQEEEAQRALQKIQERRNKLVDSIASPPREAGAVNNLRLLTNFTSQHITNIRNKVSGYTPDPQRSATAKMRDAKLAEAAREEAEAKADAA